MIKSFIQHITEDNKSAIDFTLNNIIMSKVNTVLDIKRVEIASTVYNESIKEDHDISWLDVVTDELGKSRADDIEYACKKLESLLPSSEYKQLYLNIYTFNANKVKVASELTTLFKHHKDYVKVVEQLKVIADSSKIKISGLTEETDNSLV